MAMAQVVPGGKAFVNKFVEDACRWTQFAKEPIFIIQTQWYTAEVGDIYRSMGLQWQSKERCWAVISAPIRMVPLSEILNGARPSEPDAGAGAAEGSEDAQKRVACFDKDDQKKLCYTVVSDEDLIEMLRATFELELWTSGQDVTDSGLVECEPKLFTVYHTGQLKRVFCNVYTFAESLTAWEQMCRCYLKIIKILTGKIEQAPRMESEEKPSCEAQAKRQKINPY